MKFYKTAHCFESRASPDDNKRRNVIIRVKRPRAKTRGMQALGQAQRRSDGSRHPMLDPRVKREEDKRRNVIIRVKHECKLSDKRSTDKRMHRLSDTYYAILGRRRGSRYARLDPRVKREEDKRRNVILGQAQLRSNEMDSLLLNGI